MKILIADDEYLAIEAIKKLVTNSIKEAKIVATASSGKEAILKANEFNPDVAIMDIQMPGIDGLEAIRQIKSTNSNIIFIVLTAYDFFDYAKEAIGIGALDYLLKPIKKDQLIEALEKAKAIVEVRKKQTQWEYELKEKLSLISPIIENQFITQNLYAFEDFFPKSFYENVFDENLNYGYAISLMIEDNIDVDFKTSIDIHAFFETSKILFKKMTNCIVSQSIASKQYIWMPVPYDEVDIEHELENLRSVYKKLSRQFSFSFKIGMGRVKEYDRFYESFRESDKALLLESDKSLLIDSDRSFSTDEKISLYKEDKKINEYKKDNIEDYQLKLSKFAENIANLDFIGAKKNFKHLHDAISSLEIESYRLKLLENLMVAEKNLPVDNTSLYSEKIEMLLKSESIPDMANQFSSFILSWESDTKDRLMNIDEGIIPDAMKYIEAHYNENISMDDVAKYVSISYHYFSKMFKQQTGKSFTDYLTDLRIEKSIEMLEKTQKSIKDISLELGYNDSNYFCKIFKKITGLTPTEYRLENEKG